MPTAETVPAPAAPAAKAPATAPVVAPAPVAAPPAAKPAPNRNWGKALDAQSNLLKAQARVKELEQQTAQHAELLKSAKTDPLKVLEATGLTYRDIAEAVARKSGVSVPPPAEGAKVPPAADLKPLEEKLTKLEEAQKLAEETRTKESQQALKSQVARFVSDIAVDLETNHAEKFPLLVEFKGAQLVWNAMEKSYDPLTGKSLNAEEAAAKVEAEIAKELDAFKAAHPKLMSRFAGAPAVAEAAPSSVPGLRKPKTGFASRNRAPSLPVAAVQPAPAPVAESEPKRPIAPSGVRKRNGESFGDYMKRIGK